MKLSIKRKNRDLPDDPPELREMFSMIGKTVLEHPEVFGRLMDTEDKSIEIDMLKNELEKDQYALYYIPELTLQNELLSPMFHKFSDLPNVFDDRCINLDKDKNLESVSERKNKPVYELTMEMLSYGYDDRKCVFILSDPAETHRIFTEALCKYSDLKKLGLRIEYAGSEEEFEDLINRYNETDEEYDGYSIFRIRPVELSKERVSELCKKTVS